MVGMRVLHIMEVVCNVLLVYVQEYSGDRRSACVTADSAQVCSSLLKSAQVCSSLSNVTDNCRPTQIHVHMLLADV